jgi:hypothetical protein
MASGTPPPPTKLSLTVKDTSGVPSSTIPLEIDAKAATSVIVTGLPAGAKLSAGTSSAPGTWTLQPNDLTGLTLTLPSGYRKEAILQVIAQDATGSTQEPLAVQLGPPDFTPGTTSQKLVVFIFLLLIASLVLGVWFSQVGRVQSVASNEVSVAWTKPDELFLKPGPPSFRYDPDKKKLFYRGLMDASQKEALVKLVPNGTDEQTTKDANSYLGAIDQLAYASNDKRDDFIFKIFLLGGLSGVAGVLMRSLFNFVRVTCFENKFDWHRWWPWYTTRPALGFFLGLVCVLFVEANLFQANGQPGAGVSWWIGIALLAGFATDDFVEKIRLIGQTLFGDASSKSETKQPAKSG